MDSRLDFQAVADQAGIDKKLIDFRLLVSRNFDRIEVIECRSIIRSFFENRLPTQPRLCAFEGKKFKQIAIVMDGHAPLIIVVGD